MTEENRREVRSGTEPAWSGLRLLLVSDNEGFRTEVGRAFASAGARVLAFASPAELAAAAPIGGVDLGIVDYTFGAAQETGLVLADHLHESSRDLPIIVTSCHWTPHLSAECGRRWATFCLRKRCAPDEVVAIAWDVVRGRVRRQAPATTDPAETPSDRGVR